MLHNQCKILAKITKTNFLGNKLAKKYQLKFAEK